MMNNKAMCCRSSRGSSTVEVVLSIGLVALCVTMAVRGLGKATAESFEATQLAFVTSTSKSCSPSRNGTEPTSPPGGTRGTTGGCRNNTGTGEDPGSGKPAKR